jgi:hypothetical protein
LSAFWRFLRGSVHYSKLSTGVLNSSSLVLNVGWARSMATDEWAWSWRTHKHQAKATLAQRLAPFLQRNLATCGARNKELNRKREAIYVNVRKNPA